MSQLSTKMPTPDEVGRYYDQMAGFYKTVLGENIHVGYWRDANDRSSNADAQDRLTDLMIEHVKVGHGDRVLDVGCGTGRPAVRLSEATGASVLGITPSEAQVAAFNARAQAAGVANRVVAKVGDAMSLTVGDGLMNGAWALESLLHMPDRRVVLKEIYRTLKPGARLVLTDLTEDQPLNDEERSMFYASFLLSSLLTQAEYPALVESAGFRVLQSFDIGPNTRRTIEISGETLRQNQAKLTELYGPEFVAQIMMAWPLMANIQINKLGYLLLVAEKPL